MNSYESHPDAEPTPRKALIAEARQLIRELEAEPPRPRDEDGDTISIFHQVQAGDPR